MFERFTEKARRVVFFARYEASQTGSRSIETEHLLLGLLRDDQRLAVDIAGGGDPEALRNEVLAGIKTGKPIGTNTDLPLSQESKRVLAYAAEESERLAHRHIGTEHLLLALLRVETCHACKVLRKHGLNPQDLRHKFADPRPVAAPRLNTAHSTFHAAGKAFRSLTESTIMIRDAYWSVDYVRDAVSRCKEFRWHWQKTAWTPRDLAVNLGDGSLSFDAALAADAEHFQLVKGAWKKDYCEICRWELFESSDPEHATGFTNGHVWLCLECHEKFFAHGDSFGSGHSDMT